MKYKLRNKRKIYHHPLWFEVDTKRVQTIWVMVQRIGKDFRSLIRDYGALNEEGNESRRLMSIHLIKVEGLRDSPFFYL